MSNPDPHLCPYASAIDGGLPCKCQPVTPVAETAVSPSAESISYIFPFSVVRRDKGGYYRDKHVQNIEVVAKTRDEAMRKVKDLAGDPPSGYRYVFYMGDIKYDHPN